MTVAKEILAIALRVPLDRIRDDTRIHDLPSWDSLGHMALIAVVEERLGATLSMDEILTMTSVAGLHQVISERERNPE